MVVQRWNTNSEFILIHTAAVVARSQPESIIQALPEILSVIAGSSVLAAPRVGTANRPDPQAD